MKKHVIIAILAAAGVGAIGGGAVVWRTRYLQSPNSLTGLYKGETGTATVVVEANGPTYDLTVCDGTCHGVSAVPMTGDDQEQIGGNAVNFGLVGLKSQDGSLMVFRVDPGFTQWGVTFPSGYGCYGGPYPERITPLIKLK